MSHNGKSQKIVENVLRMFISSHEFTSIHTETPNRSATTWKYLSEHFKKIFFDRKVSIKSNGGTSGILDVYEEKKQLLDDLILEIDDHNNQPLVAK